MSLEPLPPVSLDEAYPGCPNAVSYCERHLKTGFFWRSCALTGLSPQKTIDKLKEMLPSVWQVMPIPAPSMALAKKAFDENEFDHDDFLKYVRAKLGAL